MNTNIDPQEADTNVTDWLAMSSNSRHKHAAPRLERAMGKSLPTCKICVHDLSISASVTVLHTKESTAMLPTLWNTVRNYFNKLNAKRDIAQKVILKDVNAIFHPGKMTLILGQPGSGKSTLLKHLSGRIHFKKNMSLQGQITYNGVDQNELRHNLAQTVKYVHQRDHHLPLLTVRETLEFAREFCRPDIKKIIESDLLRGSLAENQEARAIIERYDEHTATLVLKTLGLEGCQNTIVGDAMIRGISGGERKRVTTGEMQFGFSNAYMMDEISTGLDSAATYDIVRSIQSSARNLKKTVVIGLLQPSPEVFNLFDNMILLNQGRIIYQGPCDEAIPYFEKLGFYCPPLQDHADFLLDICTSHQYRYVKSGMPGKPPSTAMEFADLYQRSSYYQALKRDLQTEASTPVSTEEADSLKLLPQFQQTFWQNVVTLLRRQAILLDRSRSFITMRLIMSVLIGLIYGSLFYDIDLTQSQLTVGVMFIVAFFLILGQSAQLNVYITARALFYKQRDSNFYRTEAFIIAMYLNTIPIVLLDTIVFGTITYWMCGLVSDAVVFIFYLIILFLLTLSIDSFFYFVTTIAPDINIVQPASLISIGVFATFAGFMIVKDVIPDWLIWLYWIDPLAWGIRSLMVFQYRNSSLDVCVYQGIDYCTTYGETMGVYSLKLFQIPSDKFWSYGAILYLLAVYFFFMYLAYLGLKNFRHEEFPPPTTIIANEADNDALPNSDSHVQDTQGDYVSDSTPRAFGQVVDIPSEPRPFIPITLAFQDLWYSVLDPKNPMKSIDLLKGVSGYALPGTMTALMGSSGAGKTTLMDVIAGRKTGGRIQGKITLNGHEASRLAVCRLTGYCEQMDIHCDSSTIRESLMFSARLRQDRSTSDSDVLASVQESLNILDLNPIADKIVRGSSVEEMKRLTIGVELAAKTSVIFLDEPTSGLDAHAAKVIMDGVRKVADSGRTIVCTIHQPSYAVFSVFDQLLLLRRGGSTVYFGPLGHECNDLIRYFESQPGIAPIRQGYNPATWMLECIGAGVGKGQEIDFAQIFAHSEQKTALTRSLEQEGVGRPSRQYENPTFQSKRASSSWIQCHYVVRRFFHAYWRTPSYNLTRIAVAIGQAIIFGFVYLLPTRRTYQDINSSMGMVFGSTLFIGITTFNSALPFCFNDRSSYYRERVSQTYNALWYFLGGTLVEIPYILFSCLIYTLILFNMMGFQHFSSGVIFWIGTSLYVLLSAHIAQFWAYMCPSFELAALAGVLFNTISIALIGFNPPHKFIPQGYVWLHLLIPYRYPFSVVASVTLAKCSEPSDIGCRIIENAPPSIGVMTMKEYVEDIFGTRYGNIARDFGITIAFSVAFRIFALLALRFVNHQKR